MTTEKEIQENLEDFLFSLDVWLSQYGLSLIDFYEWEDNAESNENMQ
jgi:hypothetical protein